MEAGNRALNAVFASKLAAKGKSLAELLQPHSIGKPCDGVVFVLFFFDLKPALFTTTMSSVNDFQLWLKRNWVQPLTVRHAPAAGTPFLGQLGTDAAL